MPLPQKRGTSSGAPAHSHPTSHDVRSARGPARGAAARSARALAATAEPHELPRDPDVTAPVPRDRVRAHAPPQPARARDAERGRAAGVRMGAARAEALSRRHAPLSVRALRARVSRGRERAHTAVPRALRGRAERVRARHGQLRLPVARHAGVRALPA